MQVLKYVIVEYAACPLVEHLGLGQPLALQTQKSAGDLSACPGIDQALSTGLGYLNFFTRINPIITLLPQQQNPDYPALTPQRDCPGNPGDGGVGY